MSEEQPTRRDDPFETADGVRTPIVDEVQEADVVGPVGAGPATGPAAAEPVAAEEIVDAYPVLAEVRPLPATVPAALPAVQAAAAAATGFVAGAATLALCRRLGARRLRRARSVGGRAVDLPIVGTRTFLVDVHLIAKPGE